MSKVLNQGIWLQDDTAIGVWASWSYIQIDSQYYCNVQQKAAGINMMHEQRIHK